MALKFGAADASFRLGDATPAAVYLGTAMLSSLGARTLYFNGAVNDDWSTLGNWWNDAVFTSPATSLPSSIDSVVVSGAVASNSGSGPTIVNFTTGSGRISIAITASGAATFGGSARNEGTLTGNATFGGSAINDGTVTGIATFTGSARNEGTVAGAATFDGSSTNAGTASSNATFSDIAINDSTGTVSGNATFNGSSANDGDVAGNATFNGESSNNDTVSGDATFNDDSSNSTTGTVGGDATFNADSRNSGNVVGEATFNGGGCNAGGTAGTTVPNPPPACSGTPEPRTLYFNGAVSDDWQTLGNWWADEEHTIPSLFLPRRIDSVIVTSASVTNTGSTPTVRNFTHDAADGENDLDIIVTLTALFKNEVTFSGRLISRSTAQFTDDAVVAAEGVVTGNALFTGISLNYGTIEGSATLENGSPVNFGDIEGSATFRVAGRNSGIVRGGASFSNSTINNGGTIFGYASFFDFATNFGFARNGAEFGDNSSNGGVVSAPPQPGVPIATFAGYSRNSNTVSGDAVFRENSLNTFSSQVSGAALFEDDSRNEGRVDGIATFTDNACNFGGTAGGFIPDPPPFCGG